MRYRAVACDYDGTLATDGRVAETTIQALDRAARSGRSLVLVTGRRLDDVMQVFPRIDLFAMVVAENGGLLYDCREKDRQPLAAPAPPEFVDRLRAKGVTPLGVGSVIVDTWQPHDVTVLEAIRELGLELQVIYNKGAVMVLPPGVNKATGLGHALRRLGLSRHNVVGIGDAENDHAFLATCECAVAVADALPSLTSGCDLVTTGSRGDGVEELIDRLLDHDIAESAPPQAGPRRHHVLGDQDSPPSVPAVLSALGRPGLNSVIAVGGPPEGIFRTVAERVGTRAPDVGPSLPPGRLALWHVGSPACDLVELVPATGERRRHRRKYALGTMGAHNSFWFRGPHGRLRLRAHNLALFLQIGAGVDDETWLYHLTRGDYSRWLADVVGDAELAHAVAAVETAPEPRADQTREAVRKLITDHYTLADRPDTYERISALD